MILIHSRATDETTVDVIQWLAHLRKPFVRFNSLRELVTWDQDHPSCSPGMPRFDSYYLNGKTGLLPPLTTEKDLDTQLREHLGQQLEVFLESLTHSPAAKRFGNNPFSGRGINKLVVLQMAAELGLNTPPTAIVTNKRSLQALKSRWGRVITKSMDKGISIRTEQVLVNGQKTEEVTDALISEMSEQFFPSMVQKLIPKQYEVRTFAFRCLFRSVAIFSQANPDTAVDNRREDPTRPNRQVPFELPNAIGKKLAALMDQLQLNYGSFDLICTPENDFIFLEVNPFGQYGFLSMAGNFYLEKTIAEYL